MGVFWGVEIKPGEPFTHRFDKARGELHITQATLGVGWSTETIDVQCNVRDKGPISICGFSPYKSRGCPLDLEFKEEDDVVVFSVVGPLSVHLTGFFRGSCSSRNGEQPSSLNLGRPKMTAKGGVQEEAYSFRSHFPCFVTSMKYSNVNGPFYLTIPVGFAREHLPSDFEYISLKNKDGNTLVVPRYHYHQGVKKFIIGWRLFVRDNHIKQGDYCVFELVEKENLIMNVHIFRCL